MKTARIFLTCILTAHLLCTVVEAQRKPEWSISHPVDFSRYSSNAAAPFMNRILWKPFDVPTIGVQTLTGTAGLGLAYGLVTLIAPEGGSISSGGATRGVVFLVVVGIPTMAISFPAGFYVGGDLMGGNGSLLWTLAGGVGGGAFALAMSTKESSGRETVVRAVAFAFVGSVFGYHLSASPIPGSGEVSLSFLGHTETGHRAKHLIPQYVVQQTDQLVALSVAF